MTKRAAQNEPGDTVRPAEAAAITGLHRYTLARMADRGQLTVSKPGGTERRYLRSEVEALAKPVGTPQ